MFLFSMLKIKKVSIRLLTLFRYMLYFVAFSKLKDLKR